MARMSSSEGYPVTTMMQSSGHRAQQLLHHFVARELAHLHVEQHDVRHALFGRPKQVLRMRKRADRVVAFIAEKVLDVVSEIEIVVEDRDLD